MKVKELIEKLKTLDPEAYVLVKANHTWVMPTHPDKVEQIKAPPESQKDGIPEHYVIIKNA